MYRLMIIKITIKKIDNHRRQQLLFRMNIIKYFE